MGIDPRTAALGPEAGSLPLPVGTVLERGFIIRSVLGRGGFGVTYKAEHTGLGKRFALKEHFPEQFAVRQGFIVRPTSTGAQMFKWGLDRFLEEAKRLARFKHPSVVDVSDVFEANGTAYMALAYEEGETLGQWLDRLGRPPTQAELDRLLGPILDALEHVHGHGILHRDIAPDNIMIRRDGTPVLIDFGAARQAMAERSHTLTGIVKHGYSPPEQYSRMSARHGPWSDVYALGATLYRAVSGTAPQDAPDRVLGDQVRDLSGLAAKGYRIGFLAAIFQALTLSPDRRPQSVAVWRTALLPGSLSAPSSRSGTTATKSVVAGEERNRVSNRRRALILGAGFVGAVVLGIALRPKPNLDEGLPLPDGFYLVSNDANSNPDNIELPRHQSSPIRVGRLPLVPAQAIKRATVVSERPPSVTIHLSTAGSAQMRSATAANLDREMALVIRGVVVLVATIRTPVSGPVSVTGNFTTTEVDAIARRLNHQRQCDWFWECL